MANTRELRRRIRSVKNTSQITKAMQMVAATKMRRAQNQAIQGRPYSHALNFSLAELVGKVDTTSHPFFEKREFGQTGVLLLSTDKSLCGALNTNLFRSIQQFCTNTVTSYQFYTHGKKGRQFVVKTGKELEADFENTEAVTFRTARQLAKLLVDKFMSQELKEVFVIYPDFISALRQEPKIVQLLPITDPTVNEGDLSSEKQKNESAVTNQELASTEFKFEPDPAALLEYVLNHSIETKIYQALLETKASEHSARMIAMQNATDNAQELVSDLTLAYNQTRQDAITRELLEITTAQAAME